MGKHTRHGVPIDAFAGASPVAVLVLTDEQVAALGRVLRFAVMTAPVMLADQAQFDSFMEARQVVDDTLDALVAAGRAVHL